MIGRRAFLTLTASELREYIEECGGVVEDSARVRELQSLLRECAPGIGSNLEQEVSEG